MDVRTAACRAREIATIDRLVGDRLLPLLAELLADDDLDVRLFVSKERGTYTVTVIASAGERLVAHHELGIDQRGLDERDRLMLLGLSVETTLEAHERWRRQTNTKLVAIGVAPIPALESVPRHR